ncbi:MAG: class I adenylate-forming enzyme family protein [Thermodesulfobacteriota bacterium]
MNIVESIRKETTGYEENTAVIDHNRRITYRELLERVDSASRELAEAGTRSRDRIAFLCRDCLEYIVVSLAILETDAAIVPIPTSFSGSEVRRLLQEMRVNALLYHVDDYSEDWGSFVLQDNLPQTFKLAKSYTQAEMPHEYHQLHPAFIRFSSGTTGQNKGVVISHQSILERTNAAQKALQVGPSDNIIWVLDMSFHFVVTILLFLRKAATIILSGHSFPMSLQEALITHRGTFLYASPFHYNMMLRSDMFTPEQLRHIRLAISTAMRQPLFEIEEFYNKFGIEINEAYGIIEVGLPFVNLSHDPDKRGSVGTMIPDYQVRLKDPDEQGVGQVMLRGPGMFDAYFEPWKLREELLQDGYFNTGDLGYLDKDGFLFISGREKNVINFAGMKIFPEEVEEVLNQHPIIEESLVYGSPHEIYGELPYALVVLKDDQNPDMDSVRKHCYSQLASNKVPKGFNPVPELPRTASGKIKRW